MRIFFCQETSTFAIRLKKWGRLDLTVGEHDVLACRVLSVHP